MREMSTTLQAAIGTTAEYGHNLTAGEAREAKLIDALGPFIPERFSIVSGTATNLAGARSAQQDAMFFDRVAGAPFVRVRDHVVLPIEVVSASVQVKTAVSASDMGDIVDNLVSLKRLLSSEPRPILSLSSNGVAVQTATSKPFAALVALTASKSEPELMYAFAEASRTVEDANDRPDVALVLGRGLIVWAQEQVEGSPQLAVPPAKATHMGWIPAAEDSMLMFYLLLINALASHIQPPYSPGQYMEVAGSAECRQLDWRPARNRVLLTFPWVGERLLQRGSGGQRPASESIASAIRAPGL